MKYIATLDDESFTVDVEENENDARVEINGSSMRVDLVPIDGDTTYSLLIDDQSYTATLLEASEICRVMIEGAVYEFEVEAEELVRLRTEVKRKRHGDIKQIKAPMPGRVIAVEVEVGDVVESGQGIIIVEAMKMENELRAHVAGKIKEIRVNTGDTVNKGDVLVVLEG